MPASAVRLAAASAVALSVVLGLRWLLPSVRVAGESNAPTLNEGDVLIATRIWRGLRRGDFVVFRRNRFRMVKRIVGLPGEEVELRGTAVLIDGKTVAEPYRMQDDPQVRAVTSTKMRFPVRLAEYHYFVLGDNRSRSTDSRSLGPIVGSEIEGRVLLRMWPKPSLFGMGGAPGRHGSKRQYVPVCAPPNSCLSRLAWLCFAGRR
jgi:signal peptidase I